MITIRKCSPKRRAVALVELAVCMPILVLFVLGSIELSNFIFLKQAVTIASYEGARNAVRPLATDATSQSAAEAVLTARSLYDSTFAISPSAAVDRGNLITITVSAPSSANRVVIPQFIAGLSVSASTTMVKE